MKPKVHELLKRSKMTVSKKLMILTMIIAGSLVASSAYSQVRVDAQFGPATVIYERDYPGYQYYSYPAWRGHYRDRDYYAHYHRRFERDHRAYFFRHRFDRERFERDRYANRGRGDWNRGYDHRH